MANEQAGRQGALWSFLHGIDHVLTVFERSAVAVLFTVSIVVIIIDIVMRGLGVGSLNWATELTRYAIIWMVFLGGAIGARKGAHVTIDLISEVLPEAIAHRVLQIATLISALGSLLLFYYSVILVQNMLKFQQVSAAMQVPMWIVYLALPIGFALMALRFLQHLSGLNLEERRRARAESSN